MNEQTEAHSTFPWQPYKAKHELIGNKLFDLESIIALSKKLSPDLVEYNSGAVPINCDPRDEYGNSLSIEETIASIENNGSWLVLKQVQQDPDYKAFLDQELSRVLNLCDCSELGECDSYRAFLFVSSPDSITPFHADPEHNFLMQLRGQKTMYQWLVNDQAIVSNIEMENTYFGENAHRNLPYDEQYMESALQFDLEPGDMLHVPLNAPHWVKNGDQVSVSFSITFQSDYSRKKHKLFTLYAMLRTAGLTKLALGENKLLDQLLLLVGFKGVSLYSKVFS